MLNFINNLFKISKPIKECEITNFKVYNSLLEDHENVQKITKEEFLSINKLPIKFKIPLKAGDSYSKSNLNVFLVKGVKIKED